MIIFVCLGSPNIKSGERYESNEIEKQFSSRARTLLYKNMFTFSFIGGSIPYLTISIMRRGGFNNALRNINKTTGVNVGKETPNIANNTRVKQPIFITTTCAVFGSFLGIMQARLDIAREHLGLHGSPLATEARYQLWKLNPDHIYLREHQHEFEKFESYSILFIYFHIRRTYLYIYLYYNIFFIYIYRLSAI